MLLTCTQDCAGLNASVPNFPFAALASLPPELRRGCYILPVIVGEQNAVCVERYIPTVRTRVVIA